MSGSSTTKLRVVFNDLFFSVEGKSFRDPPALVLQRGECENPPHGYEALLTKTPLVSFFNVSVTTTVLSKDISSWRAVSVFLYFCSSVVFILIIFFKALLISIHFPFTTCLLKLSAVSSSPSTFFRFPISSLHLGHVSRCSGVSSYSAEYAHSALSIFLILCK
jgi:hypothetical protein